MRAVAAAPAVPAGGRAASAAGRLGVLGHFLGQTSGVNEARDAVAAKLPEPSGEPVSPIPRPTSAT
jgi:hypothetical protein